MSPATCMPGFGRHPQKVGESGPKPLAAKNSEPDRAAGARNRRPVVSHLGDAGHQGTWPGCGAEQIAPPLRHLRRPEKSRPRRQLGRRHPPVIRGHAVITFSVFRNSCLEKVIVLGAVRRQPLHLASVPTSRLGHSRLPRRHEGRGSTGTGQEENPKNSDNPLFKNTIAATPRRSLHDPHLRKVTRFKRRIATVCSEIGFWELALIGVVAMIVVGPERLPGWRAAGLWLGKARRMLADVKAARGPNCNWKS